MLITDRYSTYWKRTGLRPNITTAIGNGNFQCAIRMDIMSYFPNRHMVDVLVANKYKCVFLISSEDAKFKKAKLIKNIDVPKKIMNRLEGEILKVITHSKAIIGRG